MTITVVGEVVKEQLTKKTEEAISKAVKLKSKTNHMIQLLLIGERGCLEKVPFNACGCDRVVVYDIGKVKQYNAEDYIKVMEKYYDKYKPDIILFTVGTKGLEVAPRLAYRIKGSCMLDCIDINYDENFYITKPIYGGNVYAEFTCKQKPLIISLRAGQEVKSYMKNNTLKVIYEAYECKNEYDYIKNRKITLNKTDNLEKAKTVIVCGRGIEGKDGINIAKELASKIDGVVAGTKKTIDNGWISVESMIGQTGNIISPDMCIVIGASGATPFVNGIQNSKQIIAINKDKNARVFDFADFGIVEDYKKIIPKLIEKIKR